MIVIIPKKEEVGMSENCSKVNLETILFVNIDFIIALSNFSKKEKEAGMSENYRKVNLETLLFVNIDFFIALSNIFPKNRSWNVQKLS